MTGASDKELVDLCLRGNNKAFDELVDRYEMTMYRTALSIVKDPAVAKDVTQNGFVKSWEKLDTYDPKYKFFSWLYRIISNEALNKVRGDNKTVSLLPNHSDGETPFIKIIRKEKNRQLYKAINSLDRKFSSVIYLRHFDELSYAEIAETLEIDEKKVKSRLYGARMKLRERLLIDR